DRQNLVRLDALVQQVADAAGDDARLAAARTSQDEQRAFDVGNRFALSRGQIREQIRFCVLHQHISLRTSLVHPGRCCLPLERGGGSLYFRILQRWPLFAKISRRNSSRREAHHSWKLSASARIWWRALGSSAW